jgi:hypothetical protein
MTASPNLCKFGESIFCCGSRADRKHLSPLPAKRVPGLGTQNMPRVALLAISVAMAGCATPPSAARHALLASKGCSDVAQARMNDAAANAIEPALQQIIFRDTYDDCVHWQDKAANITSAVH